MIYHHDLINITQRFGDRLKCRRRRFNNSWQFFQNRLETRSVVELTPRRGFLFNRSGFGQSLCFGGFSVCKPLGLYLRRFRQTKCADFLSFGTALCFNC
jgi:hypothetical protein